MNLGVNKVKNNREQRPVRKNEIRDYTKRKLVVLYVLVLLVFAVLMARLITGINTNARFCPSRPMTA